MLLAAATAIPAKCELFVGINYFGAEVFTIDTITSEVSNLSPVDTMSPYHTDWTKWALPRGLFIGIEQTSPNDLYSATHFFPEDRAQPWLRKYDLTTGEVTQLYLDGDMGIRAYGDLAWNPQDSRLYTIVSIQNSSLTELISIDLQSLAFRRHGSIPIGGVASGLAFDDTGRLFSYTTTGDDFTGIWREVNPTDASVISKVVLAPSPKNHSFSSLDYDPRTSTMYLMETWNTHSNWISSIDVNTGQLLESWDVNWDSVGALGGIAVYEPIPEPSSCGLIVLMAALSRQFFARLR